MSDGAGRRGWMLVAGALLLVGLVGAAVVMWIAAGDRRADNVAGFARAPVGCDTTLDFQSTGTFVLYIETSGELGGLAGACDAQLKYARDADDIPRVELTLRDTDGDDVELAEARDVSYDVDGFVGVSAYDVEIGTVGDHVLTVAPAGGDAFAIAVGRTPDQGVALLRWGAVAAAIGGLVVGGLLLVLGSRRPVATTTPPAAWTPDGGAWPASPPGFPVPPPTTGASGPAGPPPTTGASGPAGPPLTTPFTTTTTTTHADGPPSSRPAAPNDDRRSPWGPPSSPQ